MSKTFPLYLSLSLYLGENKSMDVFVLVLKTKLRCINLKKKKVIQNSEQTIYRPTLLYIIFSIAPLKVIALNLLDNHFDISFLIIFWIVLFKSYFSPY